MPDPSTSGWRREAWLAYVKSAEFKRDLQEAQQLMRVGDVDGLAALAGRNGAARALLAARRAREQRPPRSHGGKS